MADPYLTPEDLKGRIPDLGDDDPELLAELVAEFEGIAEDYRGVAYTPREAEETHRVGYGSVVLDWPYVRSLAAVTVDGTAWTTGQVDDADIDLAAGILRCTRGRKVVVAYEHGHAAPPAAVLRACREFVRSKVNRTTTERGSIDYSEQSDASGNTYSFLTADKSAGRPTGLPEVDAILNSLPDHRTPGIA